MQPSIAALESFEAILPCLHAKKNANFEIIWCNAHWLDYSGIASLEQIVGLTDQDLPWAEYSEMYRQQEMDALAGKPYSLFMPIKDHCGHQWMCLHKKHHVYNEIEQLNYIDCYMMVLSNTCLVSTMQWLSINYPQQNTTYLEEDALSSAVLTPREQACLRLFVQGFSNQQIAHCFNISIKTVETHLEHIKLKLNCHSLYELTDRAIESGFVHMIPSLSFLKRLAKLI